MFFPDVLKYTICHSIFSFPFLMSLGRPVFLKVGFQVWESLLRKMGYGRTPRNCIRVSPQNNNYTSEHLPQLTPKLGL